MGFKALGSLALLLTLSGVSLAQSHPKTAAGSDRDKLIGAWRFISIEQVGGQAPNAASEIEGTLIYTRDGHVSVQLMYPSSASALTNEYVRNGYEASFGSYDLDEAKHIVTHHVRGSITRGLIGKDLPRAYRFSANGRLLLNSADPAEHWEATWEHY